MGTDRKLFAKNGRGEEGHGHKKNPRKSTERSMPTIVAMVHRADEENKIETVDSVEDPGNVKMSRTGKGQETVSGDPGFGKTDCQGCKGKDTLYKSGSGLWCNSCGMGARDQTQLQGKPVNGEGRALHEGVSQGWKKLKPFCKARAQASNLFCDNKGCNVKISVFCCIFM